MCGSATPVWSEITNAVASGPNLAPETSGLAWGSIGAVATEAITESTDIIGIQFQCDSHCSAWLSLGCLCSAIGTVFA
jgi:hypothetical protein